MSTQKALYVDGGSKGNGTADQQGYGSMALRIDGKPHVIRYQDGDQTFEHEQVFIDFDDATNNEAELKMMIIALAYLTGDVLPRKNGRKALDGLVVKYDSQLLTYAFKGVKKPAAHLKDHYRTLEAKYQYLTAFGVVFKKISGSEMKRVLGH